mgnify:CR=1 FL=1
MSRIGRMPVAIPAGVTVTIAEGNKVTVKGPKGTLERVLPEELTIKEEDGHVVVSRPNDLKRMKSLHGLTRTLINNMIHGVTEGYEKVLEVNGVGYRAAKQGKKLTLNLGYSHPVEMEDPESVKMVNEQSRSEIRVKKHNRMRNRFAGTAERPRLAVFRSNNHMYAQIIDDTVGNTLVAASTVEKEIKAELEKTNDKAAAAYVGTVIAKRALEKGIKEVVFDRGGFIYQGKIQALADAAREAGLDF